MHLLQLATLGRRCAEDGWRSTGPGGRHPRTDPQGQPQLDDQARTTYRDAIRWRDRRSELPAVTGFHVQTASSESLVVTVDHKPGLDPFIGLSPAQDRQTWTGRQEHGGWLVDADPTADPVLPPESAVVPSVTAWLKAAESCDAAAARSHQAVDPLLGTGNATAQFCSQHVAVAAGTPSRVLPGLASEQVVAAYNADALVWARSVALTGGAAPINVVVAPMGTTWQVIGVFG